MTNTPVRPVEPAYKTLANVVRQAILQNRYPKGHRLPTEEELAATYGLGRQTIRRAFQELASEGLIYRVRRRGTFAYPVTAPLTSSFHHGADITDSSSDEQTEVITPLHEAEPDSQVDQLLELDAGDRASTLTIRRAQHGRPLYFAHITVPPRVAELLASDPTLSEAGHHGRFTVISLIDRQWPDAITGLTQTISAVTASLEVAKGLNCEPDSSVVAVERVYSDRYGTPVELAFTYYHPTNYVMSMRLRR